MFPYCRIILLAINSKLQQIHRLYRSDYTRNSPIARDPSWEGRPSYLLFLRFLTRDEDMSVLANWQYFIYILWIGRIRTKRIIQRFRRENRERWYTVKREGLCSNEMGYQTGCEKTKGSIAHKEMKDISCNNDEVHTIHSTARSEIKKGFWVGDAKLRACARSMKLGLDTKSKCKEWWIQDRLQNRGAFKQKGKKGHTTTATIHFERRHLQLHNQCKEYRMGSSGGSGVEQPSQSGRPRRERSDQN